MRIPTLSELRDKTKEEKTAIAGSTALGIVAVLFLGWLFYFFHTIATTPAPDLQAANPLNDNGLQEASQQFQQAYASTTQFINVQGNEELEPISATSSTQ